MDRLTFISGQIEALEKQERDLLRLLSSILVQKEQLYSERKNLQSSIMLLIPDVLLIVFEIFVFSQEECSMDAALTVSHVCREWRQLAIQHPSLWSKLVIEEGTHLRLLTTFLERAKDQTPLDIVVHKFVKPISPTPRLVKFVGETILKQNIHRCQKFAWLCKSRSLCLKVIDAFNSPAVFARLTHLSLKFSPSSASLFRHILPLAQTSFPAMRSLVIEDIQPLLIPFNIYCHLRTLDLSFSGNLNTVPLSQLYSLFAKARMLEELSLTNVTPVLDMTLGQYDCGTREDRWGVDSAPSLPLLNLKQLVWKCPPSHLFYIFFLFFPTPQLRQLSIGVDEKFLWQSGTTSRSIKVTPSTFDFQSTSIKFDLLTHLDIIAKSSNPLRRILQWMDFPSLQHLDIDYLALAKNDVTCVVRSSQRDSVLPSVESIFRDPRLSQLIRLSIMSVTLNSTDTFFKYTPCLEHLTIHECAGSHEAICILSGQICESSSWKNEDGLIQKLCPHLNTIELIECHDLHFPCLKALVDNRNIERSDEEVMVPDAVTERKIKPLGGKFKKAALSSGRDMIDKPAKIRTLKIVDCQGVSEMQAVGLQELVDTVIWRDTTEDSF